MTRARDATSRIRVAALCVGLVVSSIAPSSSEERRPNASPPGQQTKLPAASSTIAVPPPEVLLVLIRTTLVALNQAVQTGNFTVLRDLGAPALQAANSPTRLGIIFADLQDRRIDLSPAVVVTPQLSEPPAVTPQNILRLAGYFPTTPLQIRFQLMFQPVNGEWRLLGMAVHCVSAPEAAALNQVAPAEATASIPAPGLPTTASAKPGNAVEHSMRPSKTD